MPLTRADKEQVDNYLKGNQPHLAKLVLERHLKDEPFDESARKVLGKIKARYPEPTTPPPAFTTPLPQATPAPAIKLKKELPPPTSLIHVDENDIATIKQLIKEQRYDDADALLVLSDHPDADKLRERLAALRVSGGGVKAKRTDEPMPDFSGRLSITIFLLIFLTFFGLIALAVWVPDARRYPDAPGAKGLLLANKISTWILRGLLAIVVFFLVVSMAALMMPVRR